MQKLKAVNLDYDTRMTEWNLKHEVISQADLKQYLKGLSDDAANSTPLTIDEDSASGATDTDVEGGSENDADIGAQEEDVDLGS